MFKSGASSALFLMATVFLLGGCSSMGSQQLMPSINSPAGQQNKDCIDRNTGKRIPGCNTIEEINPGRKPLQLTVPDNLRSAAELPGKSVGSSALRDDSGDFRPRSGSTRGTFTIPADVNKPSANRSRPAQIRRLAPPAPVNRLAQRPTATRPYQTPAFRPPVQRPAARPAPRPTARLAPRPATRPVTLPAPRPVARPAPRRIAKPVARPAVPRRATAAAPARKPASPAVRRLTLNGNTTFKVGSSKLSKRGKSELNRIAGSLLSDGTQIIQLKIEGHSDSTGAAAANQALSLRRANAVAEYLSTWGLPRSMMQTIGHGESKPVADNKTRKGRALNRRVEITATGTRNTAR